MLSCCISIPAKFVPFSGNNSWAGVQMTQIYSHRWTPPYRHDVEGVHIRPPRKYAYFAVGGSLMLAPRLCCSQINPLHKVSPTSSFLFILDHLQYIYLKGSPVDCHSLSLDYIHPHRLIVVAVHSLNMQTTFALAALVAVAYAAPQGVTQDISPPGQPLCNPTFSGEFQIQAVKPATKRDLIEVCIYKTLSSLYYH